MTRRGTPFRVGAAIRVERAGRSSVHEVAPATVALAGFCGRLSRALGVEALPHPFEGYAELLRAIDLREIELAWLPPLAALHAMAGERVVPLALPVRSGVTSFGSALFAREDGRVKNLVDLDRVSVGWVDQHSAAGYVVIRAALRARGIDPRMAFGQETFFGSHPAVVDAVLAGEVDVGATNMHFSPDGAGISRAGWGDRPVRVVALAGPIPADLLACSADLPIDLRTELARSLVDPRSEVYAAARVLLDAEAIVTVEAAHLEALGSLAVHLGETAASTLPPPLGSGT